MFWLRAETAYRDRCSWWVSLALVNISVTVSLCSLVRVNLCEEGGGLGEFKYLGNLAVENGLLVCVTIIMKLSQYYN